MRGIADTIFPPIANVLGQVYSSLNNLTLNLAQGIDLDKYLGPISGMGTSWIFLIKTVIFCFVALSVFIVAKTGYSLYLSLKQGIKWW